MAKSKKYKNIMKSKILIGNFIYLENERDDLSKEEIEAFENLIEILKGGKITNDKLKFACRKYLIE